ncbi:MAG: cohesin domain-containing protein, partial [bacterium]
FQNAQLGANTPAPAFSIIFNPSLAFPPSTPGCDENVSVQVSSGTSSFTGTDQEVAILIFNVVGSAGQTSPLGFDQDPTRTSLTTTNYFDINNGNLDFQNGAFTVTAGFSVSGTVSYYNASRPVSAAQMALAYSGGTLTASTNASGYYVFTGLSGGAITLTPSKTGDVSKITGADALLVLRYLAFLETLTNDQKIAADVTTDGAVSGADALAILRYLAFFSTNIGHTGEWTFRPLNISTTLSGNLTNQNFTAYLLGEATGDWGTSAPAGAIAQSQLPAQMEKGALEETSSVALALGEVRGSPGEEIAVPVTLTNWGEAVNTIIFSLDYDSTLFSYRSAGLTPLTEGYLFAVNATEQGKLHVAMAGVKGVTEGGDILRIVFEITSSEQKQGSSELTFSTATANDRKVAHLTSGEVVFKELEVPSPLPEAFELSQNYPNPFNPTTTIRYAVPKKFADGVKVNLKIFNIEGQMVRSLVNEDRAPGFYSVVWDGKNDRGEWVSSGLYFYAVSVGEFKATRKMIFLK